jgi:sporulation protein YlmC with PRC-barrel domain
MMRHNLVPSDRVAGTPVRGRNGEKLGTIERLMLDKVSGKVAYAVVRHAEFLGMQWHHYPVPWEALHYNPGHRGYDTDLTIEDLRAGPCELDTEFDWGDRSPPTPQPRFWGV